VSPVGRWHRRPGGRRGAWRGVTSARPCRWGGTRSSVRRAPRGAATASTGPPTCCSPGRGAGARDEPEAFSTMPRRFNEGIERIDGRPWPRDRPLVW